MVAESRHPSSRPQPPSPSGKSDASEPNNYARRLFVYEPGWRVAVKIGSERSFCYQMAPGQDYYHRLLDGEVYVFHGDERLCLACAERRGLLSYAPKALKPPPPHLAIDTDPDPSDTGFDLKDLEP